MFHKAMADLDLDSETVQAKWLHPGLRVEDLFATGMPGCCAGSATEDAVDPAQDGAAIAGQRA